MNRNEKTSNKYKLNKLIDKSNKENLDNLSHKKVSIIQSSKVLINNNEILRPTSSKTFWLKHYKETPKNESKEHLTRNHANLNIKTFYDNKEKEENSFCLDKFA